MYGASILGSVSWVCLRSIVVVVVPLRVGLNSPSGLQDPDSLVRQAIQVGIRFPILKEETRSVRVTGRAGDEVEFFSLGNVSKAHWSTDQWPRQLGQ